MPKNWHFWTVVLEKTLESPLESKESQPVHPKGDQSWIFIGRTDAEAETPVLWPPDVKTWLIRKDPDVGTDWRKEKKGMTEDEIFGCYHWFDGHELEQALGVGDGQGSLARCSPWGCKEVDMTEWLNWTELKLFKTLPWIKFNISGPSRSPNIAFNTWIFQIFIYKRLFIFIKNKTESGYIFCSNAHMCICICVYVWIFVYFV